MVANFCESPRLFGNVASNTCAATHGRWYNHFFVPASTTKRIICLANSGKHSSRCVAGKEITGSQLWIRPVSGRGRGEVSSKQRRYEDGSEPQLLDIIDIPLVEARPDGCQQENWLLDPNACWTRVERFPESDLDRLLDPVERLWIDGASTNNGQNDKIIQEQERDLRSSLRFIRVDKLVLSVSTRYYRGRRKRQVRGRFCHAGESYDLVVTDPVVKDYYRNEPKEEDSYGPAYMTISLTGLFRSSGARSKLIAAVIPVAGSLA